MAAWVLVGCLASALGRVGGWVVGAAAGGSSAVGPVAAWLGAFSKGVGGSQQPLLH